MKFLISLIAVLSLSASCAHKKEAKPVYTGVTSFEADGKKFEAKVSLPKEFKGQLPLVVIVHEWWGRNSFMAQNSEMLNKEGFATLVVDLFGNSALVETPAEAQGLATPFYQHPQLGIQRLTNYIEQAKKDPHVDPKKVYVIGFCFGGTQALNIARTGMDLAGVVSFHGGLASSLPQQPIKARVLALNGLADPMVSAAERAGFEKEMKAIKASYRSVNYPNATHAFTNPGATAVGKKYKLPIAYNKKAADQAFAEMLKFLKQ